MTTFLGNPCKHGHSWARYVVSGTCVDCAKAVSRQQKDTLGYHIYRARPDVKHRRSEYNRLVEYGMLPVEYNFMLAGQQYRCAICRTDEPGGRHNKWHVDHCHETDKVRGILCHSCNTGLGKFGDSAAGVRAALKYLERFECQTTQQTNSLTPIAATVGHLNPWQHTAQVETQYIPLSLAM